jgi:hypothetical protein
MNGVVMEDMHRSDLPDDNGGMDPNYGGTGLRRDFYGGAFQNEHISSRAFDDWLIKYRNRLRNVISDGTEDPRDD